MSENAFGGVRVLDLTSTFSGPHCTRLLADVGMEIIKIEPPEGEIARRMEPLRDGASSTFGHLNFGKRSVTMNLRAPGAPEAFKRLVGTADIVVENYRPGVMDRLGIGYAALREIKPDLIYCAISGFGQSGPSARRAAYAPTMHAASGFDLAQLSSQPGREYPDNASVTTADFLAGTYAFGAIMTALALRDRTGRGQMVDVSMLESMLTLMAPQVQRAQFPGPAGNVFYGPTATADGFVIAVVGTDRTFEGLARVAGREDWLTDPRFSTREGRRDNWPAMMGEFEAWSRQRSTAECQAALEEHGVPSSPYRTVAEVLQDPQIAHRGSLATVTDRAGTLQALAPPFRFSDAPTSASPRVADFGEDSAAILGEAGLSAEEIAVVTGSDARAPKA